MHTSILREVVFAQNLEPPKSADAKRVSVARKPYQFVHAWVLREYLQASPLPVRARLALLTSQKRAVRRLAE